MNTLWFKRIFSVITAFGFYLFIRILFIPATKFFEQEISDLVSNRGFIITNKEYTLHK